MGFQGIVPRLFGTQEPSAGRAQHESDAHTSIRARLLDTFTLSKDHTRHYAVSGAF